MTVIANADVTRFYDDFYRFLVSCDVDGVKTDAQFMIDTWSSSDRRRELANTYLDAWAIASTRHFGAKVISCMSQAPQILFRQQLSQTRPTIPVRNSDDYFPDEPNSHTWHIWANAHNALFTQHLNVFPDWDMFQTAHQTAHYHAAARCISGGPIYITDVPGHHNVELINQMTGLTPRGKTVILRPSVVGRTIDAYTGYDEECVFSELNVSFQHQIFLILYTPGQLLAFIRRLSLTLSLTARFSRSGVTTASLRQGRLFLVLSTRGATL